MNLYAMSADTSEYEVMKGLINGSQKYTSKIGVGNTHINASVLYKTATKTNGDAWCTMQLVISNAHTSTIANGSVSGMAHTGAVGQLIKYHRNVND